MSPNALVSRCKELGLDWIAITDHNSMANCPAYELVANRHGIAYTWGVEIQTAEEIHLLAYFDDNILARVFDKLLYESLLPVSNDPDFFGDQVIIDENENIINVVDKALINSSLWGIDEVLQAVREHDGYCIPAHIDAQVNSIISQLGFIPNPAEYDAFGITARLDVDRFLNINPQLKRNSLIRSSDAHYLSDLGSGFSSFFVNEPTMKELVLAVAGENNREIKI